MADLIIAAVRNTKAEPIKEHVDGDPKSSAPAQQKEWHLVLASPGKRPFERAIDAYIGKWGLNDVLQRIAHYHTEPQETVEERFSLRYLDGAGFSSFSTPEQAQLIARMMRDEIDVPGFRLEAAARRWMEMVKNKMPNGKVTQAQIEGVGRMICTFTEDLGFEHLVQCMYEGIDEPIEVVDELLGECVEGEGDDRIVYEPDEASEYAALQIALWMYGEEWQVIESNRSERARRSSGDTFWVSDDAQHDDNEPVNSGKSWKTIQRAIEQTQPRWQTVYCRLLRHIRLFGVEDAVNRFLRGRLEAVTEMWQGFDNFDFMARGRRGRPEASIAAVFADYLIYEKRAQDQEQESDADRNPTTTDPPAHTSQRSTPLSYHAELDVDPAEVDALKEQVEYLQEELKFSETVAGIYKDQLDELNVELQDAAPSLWPRHCLICDTPMANEDVERTHMALHKNHLNTYRARDNLPPLGASEQTASIAVGPSGCKRKRNSPEPSAGDDGSSPSRRKKAKATNKKQPVDKSYRPEAEDGDDSYDSENIAVRPNPNRKPNGNSIRSSNLKKTPSPERLAHKTYRPEADGDDDGSDDVEVVDAPPATPKKTASPHRGSGSQKRKFDDGDEADDEGLPSPKKAKKAYGGTAKKVQPIAQIHKTRNSPIQTRARAEAAKPAVGLGITMASGNAPATGGVEQRKNTKKTAANSNGGKKQKGSKTLAGAADRVANGRVTKKTTTKAKAAPKSAAPTQKTTPKTKASKKQSAVKASKKK